MKTPHTILTAYLLLCALLCLLGGISNAADGKRPNILFILMGDQSPQDFKFYNPKSDLSI